MKQCFGYVRVSSVKQGEGVSLKAQKQAILNYAGSNKITITRWFEEKQTAAKSGRPVFNSVIKLLKRGAADGVVMHKVDRSARNFADWAKIGELDDAGIDVHFATESMDFRSRGGRLSADIQAVIAADYIRNLREEVKKGIYGRLDDGFYPFAAPIGYRNHGKGKLKTIDPELGPLVREAFEQYATGEHSYRSLRAHMAKRGLLTKYGKPLSNCGMETMLANPFYCGVIRIKRTGQVYSGKHEPLVSTHTFDHVQEIRASKYAKKITKHNYLFRRLFCCAECSTAMIPERQKGHVYYRCHTSECPTRCVREAALDQSIKQTLRGVQLSSEDAELITQELSAWRKRRKKQLPSGTYPMQLEKIDGRFERLTDALIDGAIDQNAFNRRKEKLLLERARLEKAVKDEQQYAASEYRFQKFLELVKSLVSLYDSAIPAEKREIVEIATSNRAVSGKYVVVEPSKWLLQVEEAIAVLSGAPYRTTSRTDDTDRDTVLEELSALMNTDEVRNAVSTLESAATKRRDHREPLPDNSSAYDEL